MVKKANYKFTNKKHAKNGIVSTALASVSLLMFLALIYVSYLQKGKGGIYIGSIGLTAFIISIIGLLFGILGFKEKEAYYLFCKIGSVVNMLIILVWSCIYLVGV